MPAKCAKCSVELLVSDTVIKCVDCKEELHVACTKIGSSQNVTKAKIKNWKCENCKEESNSTISNRSNEELIEDRKSILEAIKLVRSDISIKIGEVKESIVNLSDDVRSLKSSIKILDEKQENLSQRCVKLEQENEQLTEEMRELRMQVRDVEQHSRSANLEVVGIPATKEEDVYEILASTAKALGVQYKKDHVSIAHRLRLFSRKHTHPPIIVQFVSRMVRETWLTAVRTRRGLLASEIAASFPATKVYINEHLTPSNKAALGMARRLRREGKIYFAGCFGGKVLIKHKEEDVATRVLTVEDLDRYK